MQEKKKRIRPTWTQVRQLEAEIAELKDTMKFCDAFKEQGSVEIIRELRKKLDEQIDGTSALVKDCDLWREKYQELFNRFNNISDKLKREEAAKEELQESAKQEENEKNALEERYDDLVAESATMSKEMSDIRSRLANEEKKAKDAEVSRKGEYELRLKYQQERDTLKKSNDLMDAELNKVKENNEDLEKANKKLNKRIEELLSRTLWQRILNK